MTVTPAPIDTPTPVPSSEPEFTAEQLADPVFPEWLDPEIATEQPSDDEIIQGWTEFMSNAAASFGGGQFVQHFCADGTHLYNNSDSGELIEPGVWSVQRNAAISVSQWGSVKVNPWLAVVRSGGKFFRQNVEFEIVRSVECLERAASIPGAPTEISTERFADPVFPDWLDPDIAAERPSDEKIYEGWTQYLGDALIRDAGWPHGEHWCSDGSFWFPIDEQGTLEKLDEPWTGEVRHSPALSSSEWQTVIVGFVTMSRMDGKTVRWIGDGWREMVVERSTKCLEELSSSSVSAQEFNAEQLAHPVFPDWLDPDIATERPTDDEIIAGWREFLADSFITLGPGFEQHLCADSTVIFETIPGEFSWDVTRTAAMSAQDWGRIALTHTVLSGESTGSKNTVALLYRQDGSIWLQEITEPVLLEVKRSLKCLEFGG